MICAECGAECDRTNRLCVGCEITHGRCTYCGSNDDVSPETCLCRSCGREDA